MHLSESAFGELSDVPFQGPRGKRGKRGEKGDKGDQVRVLLQNLSDDCIQDAA